MIKIRLLFAPDSFKGSLTSQEQIALLSKAAREVFPDCEIRQTHMADGGEGTMNALVQSLNGQIITCPVSGPIGKTVQAQYGILDQDTAVIEMAQASGLPYLKAEERNPLLASTFGTGELILDALTRGCRNILLAIGGSATNDGGIGAASALGIRFYDEDGQELPPCGASLIRISRIDTDAMVPALKEAAFTIMCDVDNPLLGPEGSTYVYGPQKGADPAMCKELEAGMAHYNAVLKAQFGRDYASMPGAGAAGGLAVPFLTFTRAHMKAGIDTVFDYLHFTDMLDGVDLVVTGEGKTDRQSAYGKVLSGIGRECKKKNVPAIALVGCLGEGYEALYDCGIDSFYVLADGPMNLEDSMSNANKLYLDAGRRMFRLIRTGMRID